mmetsp:Transcript_3247/g.11761  ORF Transcript_3247/g.11761 Transcript_3247/m.11761 type:complete len:345 (+) Transcript_3247:406-1440(+)
MRFVSRRSTASSSSIGRFVAPITTTRSSALVAAPSSCTRNSVFRRRVASFSPAARADSIESISSMKMTEGCALRASEKSARTSFSPSPIHLLVSADAEMLKNVASDSVATALASIVLPVPGGPNSSTPFGGERRPWKISGRFVGRITASCSVALANSSPATSSQLTPGESSSTSLLIISSCAPSATTRELRGAAPPAPIAGADVPRVMPPPPPPPPPAPPTAARGGTIGGAAPRVPANAAVLTPPAPRPLPELLERAATGCDAGARDGALAGGVEVPKSRAKKPGASDPPPPPPPALPFRSRMACLSCSARAMYCSTLVRSARCSASSCGVALSTRSHSSSPRV